MSGQEKATTKAVIPCQFDGQIDVQVHRERLLRVPVTLDET